VGKSNTTDIQIALDLILRSKIDLKKVNLGVGFYGRTYTLVDPHCVDPGCKFSDPGLPGDCSNKAGLLTFRGLHLDLPISDISSANLITRNPQSI
jgi:hypothetical protein